MKIRQYTAATMQEARLKIKVDLGPDAVILHTRSVKKGGLFGLFGREMVEVLAAIDSPEAPLSRRLRPYELAASAAVPAAVEPPPSPVAEPSAPPSAAVEPSLAPRPATPAASPSPAPPAATTSAVGPETVREAVVPAADVASLHQAVGEVRRMLGNVVQQLGQADTGHGPEGPLALLHERMLASELTPALTRQLIGELNEAGFTEATPEALGSLEPTLAAWLDCQGPIVCDSPRPKIVGLVGPTGVGKTTTIAKLAANFRLLQGLKVALVTIDTYRVAAVEQLRTYGDIIGIPVEVVVTPNALRDAIHRFADQDVILIDTAGRSPSNKMHLHELRSFMDLASPREVHLVLAATTNRANLARIAEAFEPVGIDRVIFTKIDESASFGAMVATAVALGKPLSYLTTGQSVPDDIRVAEAAAIARLLIDEWLA